MSFFYPFPKALFFARQKYWNQYLNQKYHRLPSEVRGLTSLPRNQRGKESNFMWEKMSHFIHVRKKHILREKKLFSQVDCLWKRRQLLQVPWKYWVVPVQLLELIWSYYTTTFHCIGWCQPFTSCGDSDSGAKEQKCWHFKFNVQRTYNTIGAFCHR